MEVELSKPNLDLDQHQEERLAKDEECLQKKEERKAREHFFRHREEACKATEHIFKQEDEALKAAEHLFRQQEEVKLQSISSGSRKKLARQENTSSMNGSTSNLIKQNKAELWEMN